MYVRESSSSSCDNKENLLSSTKGINQPFPKDDFQPGSNHQGESVVGTVNSSILGKRRSSERLDDVVKEPGEHCDVMKKQKNEQVSVSQSSSARMLSCDSICTDGSSVASMDAACGDCVGPVTDHHTSGMVTSDIASVGSRHGTAAESKATSADTKYSQNSVGRDIAAEFDSLFSPEVLFEFDDNSLVATTSNKALPNDHTTAVTSIATTNSTTVASISQPMISFSNAIMPQSASIETTSGETDSGDAATIQCIEHPLPLSTQAISDNSASNNEQDSLMLGLFGGVSCTNSSPTDNRNNPPTAVIALDKTTPVAHSRAANETSKCGKEEEDEHVQRAMDESLRGQVRLGFSFPQQYIAITESLFCVQSSDAVLLQQMGLSEEEQLKLALELSMQGNTI